jgi:hypothetical protein
LKLQVVLIGVFGCFIQFYPLIPTVAITILGLVAALMTVREKHSETAEKCIWVIIAFGLMVFEIKTTYSDREKYDARQTAILKDERQSFEDMLQQERTNFDVERKTYGFLQQVYQQQVQENTDLKRFIASASKARANAMKVENLPEISLKKRASDLSAEILSFLVERQRNEPRPPIPMTREASDKYFSEVVAYLNQTMAVYAQQFTTRVMSIREGFLKQGIKDADLDEWYKNPTNTHGIEIIAGRIGILADMLKQ